MLRKPLTRDTQENFTPIRIYQVMTILQNKHVAELT